MDDRTKTLVGGGGGGGGGGGEGPINPSRFNNDFIITLSLMVF